MKEEITSLYKNKTRELVPKLENIIVEFRWIYKVKVRFKARQVALGFTQ